MTVKDLFDTHGPSRADLEELERIGRHREGFRRAQPANPHQTNVRERLFHLLDAMEEVVCEEGHAAPSLEESWRQVDQLEALYWESPSPSREAGRREAGRRRPTRAVEPATGNPSRKAA